MKNYPNRYTVVVQPDRFCPVKTAQHVLRNLVIGKTAACISSVNGFTIRFEGIQIANPSVNKVNKSV